MTDDTIEIGPKRQEKNRKKINTILKPKQAELFSLACKAINGEQDMFDVEFPEKFLIVSEHHSHDQVLMLNGNGLVKRCNDDIVTKYIVKWVNEIGMRYPDFWWTHKTASECTKYWKSVTTSRDKPLLLVEKSYDDVTFNRLDFDIEDRDWTKERDTMALSDEYLFFDFFRRSSNADALAAFIGSLFEPATANTNREQYLYIHGDGANGKSTILRLLARLLGSTYHTEDANLALSPFWTSSFIDKLLIVFPDCNSPSFAQSAKFKSLTGNDYIRVEEKHKPAYMVRLHCRFVFLSNERLMISSKISDMRRAIYVEMRPIPEDMMLHADEVDARLLAEAPQFLSYCRWAYRKFVRPDGIIPTDTDALKDLADDFEIEYESFWEENFRELSASEIKRNEGLPLRDHDGFVERTEVSRRLRQFGFRSNRDKAKVIDWMMRAHGVELKQVKQSDGAIVRKYYGLKARYIGGYSESGHRQDYYR